MYMTKHVVFWLYSLHRVQELQTACPGAIAAQIPVPQGGTVGYQNIHPLLWDQVPFLLTRQSSLQVKSPSTELWLPEASTHIYTYIHTKMMDLFG